MLAWGDCVWLPFTYTLQSQFLLRHPVELSAFTTTLYAVIGVGAYIIFRLANDQKDYCRKMIESSETQADLDRLRVCCGRRVTFIPAQYSVASGEVRQSYLLTCGFWGVSRHLNYFADLIGCFIYCACCGFTHALPFFYLAFMTILLAHRCGRDEAKCRGKYGDAWKQYEKEVPYRIIPFVY